MSVPADFAKMVPGFDFLQGMVKTAGGGLPGMNQWIAPTLDPDELAKRIDQLRTVQFWLEQNARMLGATVQALEVQRMTLTTLKTMNLPLADLQKSMALGGGGAAATGAAAPTAGIVDPMQWWAALTQQFTDLAAGAMKDAGAAQPQRSQPPAPDAAAAPDGPAAAAGAAPAPGSAKRGGGG